jgi:hypothetical protein
MPFFTDWSFVGSMSVLALLFGAAWWWSTRKTGITHRRAASIGVGGLAGITLALLGARIHEALGFGAVIGLLWSIREHLRVDRKDKDNNS